MSYNPSRPLAFMHVPKAAGTSITTALCEALGRSRITQQFDLHHMGAISRPDLISPECRRVVCLDPSALPDPSAGILAGHFSLSTFHVWRRDAEVMTVFREPVTRILSHWLFCRTATDEMLAPWGEEWFAIMRQARGSLMEFLEAGPASPQTDNLMLRMLLRPHPKIPDLGLIDPRDDCELLATASDKLACLSFTDVIENPAFPRNLAAWLARPLCIHSLNERTEIPAERRRDLLADFDDDGFERLRSSSRLDFALWARVVAVRMPGVDPAELANRTLARYMLALPRYLTSAVD